jgi:hypothetical protein
VPPVPEVPYAKGLLDQFIQVTHAGGRVRDQDERGVAELGHRREVGHGVERDLREHVRVDHHGAVEAEQQRVAVGRGLRGLLRADVAARARTVLDHHLLPEAQAERLGHHARAVVGDAARRERH